MPMAEAMETETQAPLAMEAASQAHPRARACSSAYPRTPTRRSRTRPARAACPSGSKRHRRRRTQRKCRPPYCSQSSNRRPRSAKSEVDTVQVKGAAQATSMGEEMETETRRMPAYSNGTHHSRASTRHTPQRQPASPNGSKPQSRRRTRGSCRQPRRTQTNSQRPRSTQKEEAETARKEETVRPLRHQNRPHCIQTLPRQTHRRRTRRRRVATAGSVAAKVGQGGAAMEEGVVASARCR